MYVDYVIDNFPTNHGFCPNCGAECFNVNAKHWADFPCKCESGLKHSGEECPKCHWRTPGMCNTTKYKESIQ